MAGFVDQLAKRRESGQSACDLTGQRQGQLVRESVVQDAAFFVAANLRDMPARGATPLTLLSLATAVEPGWIAEMFPQHLSTAIEHRFDAKNKRVAAMKLVRYHDLVIEQTAQQRDLDPTASGRCLAEAYRTGAFDLPLLDHRLKQFIARVNLLHTTVPELELAPLDEAAIIGATETGAIVTVEEHNIRGGLGGAVAEVVTANTPVPMRIMGFPGFVPTGSAEWLMEHFGPAVADPVRLHVAAKRYLATAEAGYFDRLSEASKLSLRLQGGPMADHEVRAFEASPFFADAVRLRRWDEEGKIIGYQGPPASHFDATVRACLKGG